MVRSRTTLADVRQVSVRELNRHTADVVAGVETGGRVEITRHGTPVAIMEPVQQDPLRRLVKSGDWRPARGSLPLFSESEVTAPDSAGLDAILEDRYGEAHR